MGLQITALIMCALCSQVDDSHLAKYIRSNGQLTQRLIVQDAQSGAIGRAGYELAIEPDGGWIKTQFWGEKRRKELAHGKLSANELSELAHVLADQKADELPREFGLTNATLNPNPRYLSLTFGNGRSESLLPPSTDLTTYLGTASPNERDYIRRLDTVLTEIKRVAGGMP